MSGKLSQDHMLSRSAKLQHASKIYGCECGKLYLTYSSLYLHFQKKHQIGISTKSTASNRITTQVNGQVQ